MDLVAYDERDRPYLARALAVGLALAAAVISALIVLLVRSATDASASPGRGAPTTGASKTPACAALRQHADAVLRDAQVLDRVLATQTRVMNDLLAHRVTLDKALPQALPELTRGSEQSVQLDQDAAAYNDAVKACSGR